MLPTIIFELELKKIDCHIVPSISQYCNVEYSPPKMDENYIPKLLLYYYHARQCILVISIKYLYAMSLSSINYMELDDNSEIAA